MAPTSICCCYQFTQWLLRWMLRCLLGMEDPKAQSGKRRKEGWQRRWDTAWGQLAAGWARQLPSELE